jgi:hypothetical protein
VKTAARAPLPSYLSRMYRDSAHRHDEHDRAVDAIQIADGMVGDCAAALAVMRGPERPARWTAARRLQDAYAAVWPHLDGARAVLATRGANTCGYDELRSRVSPVLAVADVGGDGRRRSARAPDLLGAELSRAIDDARRGVEELRLAMPGVDWGGIDARARTLAGTRLGPRGAWRSIAGVAGALALAAATWSTAVVPPRPAAAAASTMAEELASVVEARRARIAGLEVAIGDACDRPSVLELMKLYVMDGRFEIARTYADEYEARCGEDLAVRKWAAAPRPRAR